MKVLLTGAAGFIGARTAELLLERGDEVVGIDDLNDYYDPRLKDWRLKGLQAHPGFSFERGDIADADFVEAVFSRSRPEAVINLAARAGVRYSIENPAIYLRTNASGSLVLLEAMRRHGVDKLVLASTSSLYAGQAMPFAETLPVNEPISPYAATKKAAEVMAYTYHHLFQIDVSVLRYFTVFGPLGRPDMSPFRFIRWVDEGAPIELFGDGSQSRDFTFVDDIAAGTIAALKPLGYEVINLGGGRNPVTILDLIRRIEARLGKKAVINHRPFHAADMKETWANIEKAKQLLDWTPRFSLDQGLDTTIDYYQSHRDFLRTIAL